MYGQHQFFHVDEEDILSNCWKPVCAIAFQPCDFIFFITPVPYSSTYCILQIMLVFSEPVIMHYIFDGTNPMDDAGTIQLLVQQNNKLMNHMSENNKRLADKSPLSINFMTFPLQSTSQASPGR